MLKKRIIFTLLYDSGFFVLSRNFRLQKVGDLCWLNQNYNFSTIAFHIDELVVLDISRNKRELSRFCAVLKELSRVCFAPIAAGGGIGSVSDARALLQSGADKVVVNSALFESFGIVRDLVKTFGRQCVVASVDLKRRKDHSYEVYIQNATRPLKGSARDVLTSLTPNFIGEIYLNSIDRDGTGQGYDLEMLSVLPNDWNMPIIIAGGVGNSGHLREGLEDSRVDAVATAHLFNFLGDGLAKARSNLAGCGMPLATWPPIETLISPT